MKAIRLTLLILAVMISCAAVYSKHKDSVATVIYRAAQDITVDPVCSPKCDVVVVTTLCDHFGTGCCVRTFTVIVDGKPVVKTFRISKKVDDGPCQIVPGDS